MKRTPPKKTTARAGTQGGAAPPARTPRPGGQATRQLLLETAGKLFAERGPAEVQLRHTELEQTNSTIQIADRALLKVFRQVEGGINAELEIGAFMSAHAPEARVPRVLGSVTLRPDASSATTSPSRIALFNRNALTALPSVGNFAVQSLRFRVQNFT